MRASFEVRKASGMGDPAAISEYRRDMSSVVERSFTSHNPAMTLPAPAFKKAHAKPTRPSPAYAFPPALRHAETVTSRAFRGTVTTSRASSLHLSGEPERITAESSGLIRFAEACAAKWIKSNRPG